jgi:putative membrane protein
VNAQSSDNNWKPATTAAHRILLSLFLVLLAVTCINPPWPRDFMLQHVPTTAAIAILLFVQKRVGISLLSYSLILCFMLVHVLGARYLYSNVPYNDWTEALFAFNLNEELGLSERNHYDRLVHLLFGLMISVPAWRFGIRVLKLNRYWSAVVAMMFILSAGSFYEVAEWGVAMLFSPETAENYNGQQGDVWDPQRDMLLAAVGATITLSAVLLFSRTGRSTHFPIRA